MREELRRRKKCYYWKKKWKSFLIEAIYIIEDAKRLRVGIVPKKDTSNMAVQWKNDDQLETCFYYYY